jgi:transcriptional regulator with XRE-family HTH domain
MLGMGESFGGLLLRYRARSGLTQSQLASRTGVHVRSIQCWEAEVNYPGADRLRGLIAAFAEAGALDAGHEEAAAEGLWTAAMRQAPRLVQPFDSTWFRGVLGSLLPAARADSSGIAAMVWSTIQPAAPAARREDWADAPDVSESVGRLRELATLRQWVLDQRCQIVELSGMGGIGKTTLATRLARDVAPHFDLVYWRSLKFAPSTADWLAGAITFIAGDAVEVPGRVDECLALLVKLLQERRCLLILDNLETLLEAYDTQGRFQDPFDEYGALLQSLGETRHQSCMLLTSREASADVSMMAASAVRSMELRGFTVEDSRDLLHDKQLTGTDLDWADFVARCGGNGLVLRMSAETVRQVFCGDIGSFLLAVGSNGAIHGGVRRLLASQLDERLSEVEREVVAMLARSSEPLTAARLLGELGPRMGRGTVIEALEALRRRSLIEPSESGAGLSLHAVVRDYVAAQRLDLGVAA